ncbi:HCP-like protein [Gigaspora margarita]|uniref:HCP-like protein n=1 Tax=Gigaspora margarita TaxID=4874 RepID=A0A8H4ENX1_GIGMA|nr:HCP-like protein [Gigaspora margarita]
MVKKRKINIKNPINTDNLLDKICKTFLLSLQKYWNLPSDIGLLATILDSRFKQMTNFDSTIIHKAKTLLQTEYTNLIAQTQNPNNNEENVQIENTESEDLSSSNTMKSLLDNLYEDISFEEIESDELEKYLNLPGKKYDSLL